MKLIIEAPDRTVCGSSTFVFYEISGLSMITNALGTDDVHEAELIQCKDCKYYQDNNGGYPHPECRWGHGETPDPDDYCSFGSKK